MEQITDTILMVRPAHFGFNPETAESNAFQQMDQSLPASSIEEAAVDEFDRLVLQLRNAGIEVIVIQDTEHPVKPDAVFPNNWFSTHADGTIITYPVLARQRRYERREDILDLLNERFDACHRLRLENAEKQQQYLESTGSLIFDRPNKMIYACRSIRTHPDLVAQLAQTLGYQYLLFSAADDQGQEIYHTNVMMALGETFVVIALSTVRDAAERAQLLQTFAETKKEVIEITTAQVNAFAGNMIQLKNRTGQRFLIMSTSAYNSLTPEQLADLERHSQLLHSPLPVIETYGGGSARCMIAEIFLPRRRDS